MELKLQQKNRVKNKNKYINFQKQGETNLDQCVNISRSVWSVDLQMQIASDTLFT